MARSLNPPNFEREAAYMKWTPTRVSLFKKNALVDLFPKQREETNPTEFQMALIAHTAQLCDELGFVLSVRAQNYMASGTEDTTQAEASLIVETLRHVKGAKTGEVGVFDPNFAFSSADYPEAQRIADAHRHYDSEGEWLPEYEALPRPYALEDHKAQVIRTIDADEYLSIFTTILESKDSISQDNKEIVEFFMTDHAAGGLEYPNPIPFKENMCLVAGMNFKRGVFDLTKIVKDTTDVLRIMAYLSDGDISLAAPTKFKSLPKKQRRALTFALEKVARLEDFRRHRNKWIPALHNLHVGDFSKKLHEMVAVLRKGDSIPSFNTEVENRLSLRDHVGAAELLSKRPGELARRMDLLLRKSNSIGQASILQEFRQVVKDIPTRILLQLKGAFQARHEAHPMVVFPKGSMQKARIINTNREPIPVEALAMVDTYIEDALKERFAQEKSLGKCFVDPALKECPVPSQMRSAAPGKDVVARGTRLPLPEGKDTLRFFIYWKGQDIDLSAVFLNEDLEYAHQVSYTQLRAGPSGECFAVHSGDITNAPRGASEYIDVDLNKAKAMGVRYVSMNVFVYFGPTFSEHEECFAGFMTRQHPGSNEIYDPKTVELKVDITCSAKRVVPFVFDLETREAIWVDMVSKRQGEGDRATKVSGAGNNVENNKASLVDILRAIVLQKNKVSLFELFKLHVHGRGELVESAEEADTVFSLKQGITPFSIDEINAKFIV
tara:strand:+ start:249 stop:2417 length:2169 start_codon:yes stop_codon:yes gene_type:complete